MDLLEPDVVLSGCGSIICDISVAAGDVVSVLEGAEQDK